MRQYGQQKCRNNSKECLIYKILSGNSSTPGQELPRVRRKRCHKAVTRRQGNIVQIENLVFDVIPLTERQIRDAAGCDNVHQLAQLLNNYKIIYRVHKGRIDVGKRETGQMPALLNIQTNTSFGLSQVITTFTQIS